ncbi:MAG: ABC transporter permease [Symbiobacteriaceae bacterium]|nr:ABC transporter permease [Symbiobacteriaceae bacterium]
MYVIEHALLNLGKNKGRNSLLAIIILAIITTTVVALAIYNTAQTVMEETRRALQCAVRVAPQRSSPGTGVAVTAGGGQQEAAVTLEQYLAFASSQHLDGADVKEGGRNADEVDAVYFLKRPELLAVFEAELRDKGLPDNYSVKTDESTFASVAGPVESLQKLSLTFLLIVLVLGAVIMVLLSFIVIRERKYEIGVLRAMGMKKEKIALGLWTETIIITCLCFVLGMGAGSILSQPVSDAILAGQAETSAPGSSSLADRLNEAQGVVPPTTKIDIAIDPVTALEIFAVSILLASIAGIIAVSRITKSEPIKILMERN